MYDQNFEANLISERRRKLHRLDAFLVDEFEKCVKHLDNTLLYVEVIVTFPFDSVPDELKEYFTQKPYLMKGPIYDEERPHTMYFYCEDISVENENVSAKLLRNW